MLALKVKYLKHVVKEKDSISLPCHVSPCSFNTFHNEYIRE